MNRGILAKRLGIAIITTFLSMIASFIMLRETPGDVWQSLAIQMAQQQNITLQMAYQRLISMYHYNPLEPLLYQFLDYLKGLLHGNLGQSLLNQNVSVNSVIAAALPWTLFVAAVALGISFVIGNWLGVRMAWRRKSILDPVMTGLSVVSHAVPAFVIALVLIIVFSLKLGWLPYNGAYSFLVTPGFNLPFFLSALKYAILPIATYVIVLLGGQAMSMKSTALAVMDEDYVSAAQARGLRESTIVKRYVKRIAILPQVTGLALAFGGILGASALVETLFNYPGIGQFLTNATNTRDYTELQGMFLFQSVCMIAANLIANLLYSYLDPRIKVEG
ncbi:MAG: ABC transporter permease [Alicyclobacillus sp.]|nr:ABC transporter permease [Alicyclobacillus sp.]